MKFARGPNVDPPDRRQAQEAPSRPCSTLQLARTVHTVQYTSEHYKTHTKHIFSTTVHYTTRAVHTELIYIQLLQ